MFLSHQQNKNPQKKEKDIKSRGTCPEIWSHPKRVIILVPRHRQKRASLTFLLGVVISQLLIEEKFLRIQTLLTKHYLHGNLLENIFSRYATVHRGVRGACPPRFRPRCTRGGPGGGAPLFTSARHTRGGPVGLPPGLVG